MRRFSARFALCFLGLLGCDASRPSGGITPSSNTPSVSETAPRAESAAVPERGEVLTVVSYNVNYGNVGDEETLRMLEGIEADVLLLQETTPEWERALRARLGSRYPHVAFHDPTTYAPGGLGTFSRLPIASNKLLPSPLGWFPANLLVLDAPGGPVEVMNVHLRPAIDQGSWIVGLETTRPMRKKELVTYLPHLSTDAKQPTIIAGDFNEDEKGDAFLELTRLGFQSGLAQLEPDAKTWRWKEHGIPLALRLDHVAYEPNTFELVSAEVVEGGHSDHFPVRVVLRRRS